MTLKIGALTKLGLFFPVVCFIHVFDQTLAEQLYRDKGLLTGLTVLRPKVETFYIFIGYLCLTDKIVKFVTNIIKLKLKACT